MSNSQESEIINKIFNALETLVPEYILKPEDSRIANGNCAVCIIDNNGRIHGKMFGTDKSRQRQSFNIAWIKASQVWLTGYKTGEYEKMIFNKIIEEGSHGIEAPDLIGWEGGQPLTLADGSRISVGFSGFRGVTDLEIMVRSLAGAERKD